MAKFPLTNDQRIQLVSYLTQYGNIDTVVKRRHFLDNTGLFEYIPKILAKIPLEGDTEQFSHELIRVLQNYGTLSQTKQPALILVLQYFRDTTGQIEIINFLDILLETYQQLTSLDASVKDNSSLNVPTNILRPLWIALVFVGLFLLAITLVSWQWMQNTAIVFAPTITPIQSTNISIPPTDTSINTLVPPTNTLIPLSNTPVPPTNTSISPSNTPVPPTNTSISPSNTSVPPTNTSIPPSNTLVPSTNTPLPPSNTQIPQPFLRVTESSVNVRSGPGTNYDVIGLLRDGDNVLVLGRTNESLWYNIQLNDGSRGWVAASVVEAVNVIAVANTGLVATIPVSPTEIAPTLTPRPLPTQTINPNTPTPNVVATVPSSPTTNSVSNIRIQRNGNEYRFYVDYTYVPAGRGDVRMMVAPYLDNNRDIFNEHLAGWRFDILEQSSGTAIMDVIVSASTCFNTSSIEVRIYETPYNVFFSQRFDRVDTWCP